MTQRFFRIATALWVMGLAAVANSQTTYYLRNESSSTTPLLQLSTAGSGSTAVVFQSSELKNQPPGAAAMRIYDTQAGVPGLAGVIPSGTTINITLYMRKTSAFGTVYPQATVGLNWNSPLSLCQATGIPNQTPPQEISTTLQQITISCQTSAAVTMTETDRVYVIAGYSMTAGPGNKSMKVELSYAGSTPSRAVVPNPVPPTPVITNLNPGAAPLNWTVTITGSNFGNTAGTVRFYNNLTAQILNWSNTSIQAQVPAGATSGPVTVTSVYNVTSSGTAFTVLGPPALTSLSPSAAHLNETVTIAGSNFMATQSTSTVTFNGVQATPSSWSSNSIQVPVPSGATSGNVVVTVSGQTSNSLPFTLVPPPLLTALFPSAAQVGGTVAIHGAHFGATQGTSTVTFNGTAATPTSWSNTRITTTVPAQASTGNIVVVIGNATSNGLAFTVLIPGTMSGTVSRVTGGTGISGALVQAVLTGVIIGSATTASDGTYVISNLDPGTYDVRVYASGFSTELRQGIVVTSTNTTTVNVPMYVPGGLSGTVTQATGATPIAGAAIAVYDGPSQKASTTTNASGQYTLSGLRPSSYTVQAAYVGFRTSELSATVTESSTATRDFSLDGAPAGPVQYAYDAVGRLVQVIDPSGDSAIYRYDPVGNITAIERTGAGGVSVSAFTPTRGPIGTSVSIFGTGFSTTPSSNTVTFNGAQLTVTSATPTKIVATIPAGAASGTPYSFVVTTPAGSITTVAKFTVDASSAPTITGVSPSTAAAGTAFTVDGSNFEMVLANNNLRINLSPTHVGSGTSTALQSSVPPSATTGKVSVTTPNGSAVSANYLWIAPPPYGLTDVDSMSVIQLDTGTAVSVPVNKVALRVFEATEGQRVAMSVTGPTGGNATANIYDPYGGIANSVLVTAGGSFLEPVSVRATATYSLIYDPSTTTQTAGATLTVHDVSPDFSATATPGEYVRVEIDDPGQNGVLTFAGTAQQRVSVQGAATSDPITGQVGCDVNVSIIKPDGTVLGPATCMESGGFIDATTLPVTGTYRILVDPLTWSTGDLDLRLRFITDFTGSLTLGSPVSIPLVAGQNARLTFTGAAQQPVSIQASGISGQVIGCDVNVSIVNDTTESVVLAATCIEGNAFVEPTILPAPATYRVVVDPVASASGTLVLTAYDTTDVTGSVSINGGALPLSLVPGQSADVTFSGTASQSIRAPVSTPGPSTCAALTLLQQGNPTPVATYSSCGSTITLPSTTLPATDTYHLRVNPTGSASGSFAVSVISP
jgi:YD repeat-containing protein